MTNLSWWLIEMQGPAYLCATPCGGYVFEWTENINKAIRLHDQATADTVMMAVRQLRGDLFPPCLTRSACAVEHMWVPGEGVKRSVDPPKVTA